MSGSPNQIRCCHTCGQIHPRISGTHSTDCILIGGRAHSRIGRRGSSHRYPSPDRLTTIPLPTTIREQAMLFDQIWFWFIDMKHENDDVRDELSTYTSGKGSLRSAAPLLWLEWKRWDDVRGQTRNQENFEKAWKNFVHFIDDRGQKLPVAWLTIRSMPAEASSPSPTPTSPVPFAPRFVMA